MRSGELAIYKLSLDLVGANDITGEPKLNHSHRLDGKPHFNPPATTHAGLNGRTTDDLAGCCPSSEPTAPPLPAKSPLESVSTACFLQLLQRRNRLHQPATACSHPTLTQNDPSFGQLPTCPSKKKPPLEACLGSVAYA